MKSDESETSSRGDASPPPPGKPALLSALLAPLAPLPAGALPDEIPDGPPDAIELLNN